MAVTATWSNYGKYCLAKGDIDFDSHVFKIILMNSSFVFNPDNHQIYANVSLSELANGNGYATGGQNLSGVLIAQDNTNDRCEIIWSNPVWITSGGNIGPSAGAIIFDDTATGDVIIGCITFCGTQTISDGGIFVIEDIKIRLT